MESGRPTTPVDTTDRRTPRWIVLLRRAALRFVGAVAVCIGAVTLVFLLGALSGQDPALARLGVYADQAARDAFAAANGLDDPLPVRWLRYLGQLAHGDLGVSLVTGEPISSQLARALPVTVSLALLATLVAAVGALVLGCIAAVRAGGLFDRVTLAFASIGQSLPTFWVGLVVIQLLAINIRLIPAGGYQPITTGLVPWFQSVIAPVLVLSVPLLAALTRIVRASMLDELGRDYVRTAHGLGLPPLTVVLVNVLRNALVAPITVLGLYLGTMFAGTVLVESVFRLPGVGSLLVNAVSQGDFGLVQATAMIAAIAFVVVNLLVDLLHGWANPRVGRSAS